MERSLNALAEEAAHDESVRNELIRSQERAILAMTAKVANRYITKADDEWSVALCAYSKAIDTYSPAKGAFSGYCQLLIRRSLVDYYRRENRFRQEINVSPSDFTSDPDDYGAEQSSVLHAVVKNSVEASDTSLREEILTANEALAAFGFRFMDLTACSPKQAKTRQECAKAIRVLVQNRQLLDKLFREGQLPIAQLCQSAKASRKTLERHRRYIIAVAILLTGDYPMLSGYLKGVMGKEAEE